MRLAGLALLLAACAPSPSPVEPVEWRVGYPRKVMAAEGLEAGLERAVARWNEAAGERMLLVVGELGQDVSYVYVDPSVVRSRTHPDHIELRPGWTHEVLVHELGHHLLLQHGEGCMGAPVESCEVTEESAAEALRIRRRHEDVE